MYPLTIDTTVEDLGTGVLSDDAPIDLLDSVTRIPSHKRWRQARSVDTPMTFPKTRLSGPVQYATNRVALRRVGFEVAHATGHYVGRRRDSLVPCLPEHPPNG